MNAEPAALTRFGAWGQLGMIALAVGFWVGGISTGFLASCLGYFVVTMVGIFGMSRAESGIVGAVISLHPSGIATTLLLCHSVSSSN